MAVAVPIDLIRLQEIAFGTGTLSCAAGFAADRGYHGSCVVADAVNAGRVDRLGSSGAVTLFGSVKPEPATPFSAPPASRPRAILPPAPKSLAWSYARTGCTSAG